MEHFFALHWQKVVTIALVITAICVRELALLPDGKMHVHALDVGQGDATLLVTPLGKTVLIDGGEDLRALEHLGERLSFFDRTIDLLVLTHPHADHITALPDIV